MFDASLIGLLLIIIGLQSWGLYRGRMRVIKTEERPGIDIDDVLKQIHQLSRAAGGRVHLHDVEAVMRGGPKA